MSETLYRYVPIECECHPTAKGCRRLVPVDGPVYLWCHTHHRIPEDGTDLCGDEWRDIGECEFVKVKLIVMEIGDTE